MQEAPRPDSNRSSGAALMIGAAVSELITGASEAPITLRLLGQFSSGMYLRGSNGIFALSDESIPAGPLHLLVDQPVNVASSVAEGTLSARRLTVGDLVVELDGAEQWDPVLPPPNTTSKVFRRLLTELVDYARPPAELEPIWPRVCDTLADSDYMGMRTVLEGRGSGLTPAGDDVLAGWMMADALQFPARHRELRHDLAYSVRSTDLSRAFLRFAARGHSIEPLHRLFSQAATEEQHKLQASAADLAAIGDSSGRAMLAGILLAIDKWGNSRSH